MSKPELILVMDTEANGLLDIPDFKFWCAVFQDYTTGQVHSFSMDMMDKVKEFVHLMTLNYNLTLVCHNIYGYDLEAMRRELGIDYQYNQVLGQDVQIIDTLDMSRRLEPDRKLPKGCPSHVWCPVTERKKPVGPHGLEAWGYRVAQAKPSIHDWRDGDPQVYLHRCTEDVSINAKTFTALLEEDRRLNG